MTLSSLPNRNEIPGVVHQNIIETPRILLKYTYKQILAHAFVERTQILTG